MIKGRIEEKIGDQAYKVYGYRRGRSTTDCGRLVYMKYGGKENLSPNKGNCLLTDGVETIQFADDLLNHAHGFESGGMYPHSIGQQMGICEWLNDRYLFIPPGESAAIILAKNKPLTERPEIRLKNDIIPWHNNVKYLGFTIESDLKWKQHIKDMCNKAFSNLGIIKSLCKPSWGRTPLS
ncbi:hypothetical protein HHI36_018400 [Cryptolaemus montrouzieri]|uniref:Uncharacterized protein n=1 Tax=Cryptolaemus montrouzieri TaxID=559131 RepID=A0ABD2NZZ5_9CUCU